MIKTMTMEHVKALYPELFGATFKATAPDMTGLSDGAKLQMEMSGNTLGSTGADLWSVVAEEYADAFSKKYADLSTFCHNVDGVYNVPAGVQPVINVEVVETAGAALVNTENWEESALVNNYAEVRASRVSRPLALTSYDLAKGEKWAGKRKAAIQAVIEGVFAQLAATVAAVCPTEAAAATAKKVGRVTVDAGTFTPDFVAQRLSGLFGEYGQTEVLLLNPTLWSKVIPTNALGLNPETEGTLGIGQMQMSAGLGALAGDGKGVGLAAMRSGIAYGGGVPHIAAELGCAVRSLGTICGIPMVLKVWGKPGSEAIYESVETLAGFTVVQPQKVAVLATA